MLLVAKFARQSLQKLLAAKNHSLLVGELLFPKNHLLLVANFTRYSLQKLLTTKNHTLLIPEVARCKKLLVTCYEQNPGTNGYLKPIKIGELYLFILYFQLIEKQRKKQRKIPYTIELGSQQYNAISSQLSTMKSFNEKNIIMKTTTAAKQFNKDNIEISVIHILPM